jgi:hypothetical protein
MIMRAPSRTLLCATASAMAGAFALTTSSPAQVVLQALPPITDPATYVGFAPPSVTPIPSATPAAPAPPAPATPQVTAPFMRHIISQNIRGAYVVLAADMNRDGRTDVIALGQREDYLVWYENPYWTPHEIMTPIPLKQMVNIDSADMDGDGIPEIAVTYAFNADPKLSIGNIAILHNSGGDATAPWTMRVVDQVPAPHRVRFADLNGSGKLTLLVAPILNARAQPVPSNDPDRLPTPLYAYRAPDWRRELVSAENIGEVHALRPFDWDGDGRQEAVTGGQSGIYGHSFGKDGKWRRFLIAKGNPAPWPDNGASDVGFGKLGAKPYFAAIEPFHGNLVVVYTQDAQGRYQRNVIDNELKRGHGITMVDVDGDGVTEIVAGGGGSSANTFFYKAADATGRTWKKMLMDTSMAVQDCVTADLKGDGRKRDVICLSGQVPNNLTWYEYSGK